MTDREKKIEELHKHIEECIQHSLGEEYDANYIVCIHTPFNDQMFECTNMVRGNVMQLAIILIDLCKKDNNFIHIINAVIKYFSKKNTKTKNKH